MAHITYKIKLIGAFWFCSLAAFFWIAISGFRHEYVGWVLHVGRRKWAKDLKNLGIKFGAHNKVMLDLGRFNWAQAAGMFDGDGCSRFYLTRVSKFKRLTISYVSVSLSLISSLKELWEECLDKDLRVSCVNRVGLTQIFSIRAHDEDAKVLLNKMNLSISFGLIKFKEILS